MAQYICSFLPDRFEGKTVERVSDTENLQATIYFTDGTNCKVNGYDAVELSKVPHK